MKIAVLIGKTMRGELFSPAAMEQLGRLGQVACLENDDLNEDAVCRVLQGADIAVSSWGTPCFGTKLLDAAPNLKMVAHAAGSVKGIVSDELYARGIRVSSSACVLSRGVSEMALGLAITAAKNVFAFNAEIHAGAWPKDANRVTELYDINIGVMGCGYAGAHFIELLRDFGVHILAYDPGLSEQQVAAIGARKVELETLFRESDILSLHAPSIDSTHHVVNAESLGWMKKDAILINTARGSLINEEELARCMKAGKLKYACLDVTDPEPPAANNPLRDIPNCIFTPHVAGCANNGKRKIGIYVCDEIARFEQGLALDSEVTQAMLATIA